MFAGNRRWPPRRAFTLIELLVVIAIISVLLLLSAGAVFRFLTAFAASSTATTLTQVHNNLESQMAYVRDRAQEGTPSLSASTLAGGDPDRARVIHIKLQMKKFFPQSFYEAYYPGYDSGQKYVEPHPAYVNYLTNAGITAANFTPGSPPTPAAHESSACLYMALRSGPNAVSPDQLGQAGPTRTIGGLTCFVDAWGEPIIFCRWPTGDSSTSPPTGASLVNPNGYADGFNDPGDPKGTLNAAAWQATSAGLAFQRICHPVYPRASGKKSLNLSAALLSAGANKRPGVDLTTLAVTSADSNDNVIFDRIKK